MPYPCPGIRVVRGPGWNGKDQDGGDGHVGTVLSIDDTKGRVTVIWDSGQEFQYHAGYNDKFDLLVFDSGPTGVLQKGIVCDGCGEEDIAGVRWKCAKCTDFDLCTPCYMQNRHDVTHPFLRSLTRTSPVVRVPPRSGSVTVQSKGMFVGAQVIRGPHWRYGDQDGGDGTLGEIVKLGKYVGGYVRAAVNVRWAKGQDSLHGYRIGAEGLVALTMMKEANGWKYYKEHLPALDVLHPETERFKKGDKVKVEVDLETFIRLHKDHVGYKEDMKRCLDDVGTVVRGSDDGKAYVKVQYEDAELWAVMSCTLTKHHSFQEGDIVKITSNYNAAVELQLGHGGWNEKMADSLGELAEVLEIDSDGDLKVKVKGRTWVFSPVSCNFQDRKTPLTRKNSTDKRQSQTMTTTKKSAIEFGDIRSTLAVQIANMAKTSSTRQGGVKPLVAAVKIDDADKVKSILKSIDKSKIDEEIEGVTALHLACFKGNVVIVTSLLNAGSDKNRVSNDGNTPLHYAVSGEHTGVIEILLKAKVDKNAKNSSGVTPLHLAVVKEDPSHACALVLVKNGCDPNTQDSDGDSPLHDAIRGQDKQMVEVLLQCPSVSLQIVNSQGFNPFHEACYNLKGEVEIPKHLIQRDRAVINTVIKQGLLTPLHIAAFNGYVALAGILVTAGAEVNACDENGKTPLHLAVHLGNLELVQLLTESRADVNMCDKEGNTPMHVAQMEDNLRMDESRDEDAAIAIRCHLAENGAVLTKTNKAGQNPLDMVKNKAVRVMLEKLAKQAPRSMLSKTKQPPSHWASMSNEELKLIAVTASDPTTANEYRTVSKHMQETMYNKNIVSVHRVQNIKLWEHYAVAKASMESDYGKGQANEKSLFHGTTPTAAKNIPHQNIDFRLSGERVGAMFGLGAYFAVDAKYSDNYTTQDGNKHRFMFLAKVLVGKTRKGQRGLTRPPVYDPKDKTKLADSACDDELRPRVYVIFNEKQIYPEYIIEYA